MKRFVLFLLIILLISNTVQGADMAELAYSAPGTSNGDWSAIALMLSDCDFDKTRYINALKQYVTGKYELNDKLSRTKSTEWHRIAIAVNLAGEDATDFNGINLINDGIFYRENLGRQGLNGYVWALIAVCSGDFEEPYEAFNTKNSIINEILFRQNSDGGFSVSGNNSSCDMTAMTLYALSFFQNREEVSVAINKALDYLSDIQNDDGSFSESGIPNAESTAQVIIALSALGKDIKSDDCFSRAFDGLMLFKTDDGFSHIAAGETNTIATYQGMCAVIAAEKPRAIYSKTNTHEHIDSSVESPNVVDEVSVSETETETINTTQADDLTTEDTTNVIQTAPSDNNGSLLIIVFSFIAVCGIITLYTWRKK